MYLTEEKDTMSSSLELGKQCLQQTQFCTTVNELLVGLLVRQSARFNVFGVKVWML